MDVIELVTRPDQLEMPATMTSMGEGSPHQQRLPILMEPLPRTAKELRGEVETTETSTDPPSFGGKFRRNKQQMISRWGH